MSAMKSYIFEGTAYKFLINPWIPFRNNKHFVGTQHYLLTYWMNQMTLILQYIFLMSENRKQGVKLTIADNKLPKYFREQFSFLFDNLIWNWNSRKYIFKYLSICWSKGWACLVHGGTWSKLAFSMIWIPDHTKETGRIKL